MSADDSLPLQPSKKVIGSATREPIDRLLLEGISLAVVLQKFEKRYQYSDGHRLAAQYGLFATVAK